MRSHARASSAGSTQGRSSRSGSFVRGAGATRGTSGDADGSGAPSHRLARFLAAVVAALFALALLSSSAFAAKDLNDYFGTASGSGDRGGEFNGPRNIAVNDSGVGPANAGDIYVADELNNRIQRFSSSGSFISAWGANGSHRDEVQSVHGTGNAGTFTLSFGGDVTEPLVYFASEAQVDDALDVLPSIGGDANVDVTRTGFTGNLTYTVTFTGALTGTNVAQMTADDSALEGSIEIATIESGAGGAGSDYEICATANKCAVAVAAAGNGSFNSPQSVAVDQDTGNVYVSDRDNRRINEYDGEGNFIRSFGFDVAQSGPGDTGTGFEVCSQAAGDVCKAGVAGSGAGQYGAGSTAGGFGIAVSPADGNASAGSVYLADSGNQRVDTYDLDGTSPSSFGSSSVFGSEQPRTLAVDSRGIVYASSSNGNGDVQRYDSKDTNGGGVGFIAPIAAPVDEVQAVSFSGFAAGDKYTLTCPTGAPTAELVYSASESGRKIVQQGLEDACGGNFDTVGNPPSTVVTFQGGLSGANQPQMTCTKLTGSGSCSVSTTTQGVAGPLLRGASAGLAVDPDSDGGGSDTDVLYVLRDPTAGKTVVQQFGPGHAPGLTAAPTAVDGTHGAAAGFSDVRGLGLNETNGLLYVSAIAGGVGATAEDPDGLPAADRVYVLADGSTLSAPSVEINGVPDPGARTATFNGNVFAHGGLVGCKFQYSTDESTWTDVPAPSCASIAVNGGKNIKEEISGLVPETEYFVRIQAFRPFLSDLPPVTSKVQHFITDSAPPILSEAKAIALDDSSVRVSAEIDSSHSPTVYTVQYGPTPALGSSFGPIDIGSSSTPVEISPVIGGLKPTTTYYFKLTATNSTGSDQSGTLTTTTFPAQSSFGSCPNDQFRTGASARLPDCRAYEQATPTDKFGSDASGTYSSIEASKSGDGITFFTLAGFPGNEGFQTSPVLLSRRVGDSWSTRGLTPPPTFGDRAEVLAWTPDLELSLSPVRDSDPFGETVVLRDSSTGSYTPLFPYLEEVETQSLFLAGASADRSKLFFAIEGPIPVTSGPSADPFSFTANLYVYDRDTGALTLAGVLPDSACGSPPCVPASGAKVATTFRDPGGLPNTGYGVAQEGANAISTGGDAFFYDIGTGQLYVRHDAGSPVPSPSRSRGPSAPTAPTATRVTGLRRQIRTARKGLSSTGPRRMAHSLSSAPKRS